MIPTLLATDFIALKAIRQMERHLASTPGKKDGVSPAAPNYFEGNTYIGGTTTRNTLELWKSTLTEEQLEQLETGTLVAPANVATPGDGEFARQWWYDQQSAEDQALIDAGELEYPEHLAAATFADTFTLGDNTNINLNSDGSARFNKTVLCRSDARFQTATAINDNYGRVYLNANSTIDYGLYLKHFQGTQTKEDASIVIGGLGTTDNDYTNEGTIRFLTSVDSVADPEIRLTIKPNGNVGIGKDDPETTLDVLGDVTLRNTAGASFLGTDANGKIIAVSGGGGGGTYQDLGYTKQNSSGVVTITNGFNAEIPGANAANAGLMTVTQHNKLTGIEANATRNKIIAGNNVTIDPPEGTGDITVAISDEMASLISVNANSALDKSSSNGQATWKFKAEGDVKIGSSNATNQCPSVFLSDISNSGTMGNMSHFLVRRIQNTGTVTNQRGFHANNLMTDNGTTNYGVFSDLATGSNTNWNIYANGTAPNYFKGNITCDGLINGAFSLRTEADDPAAYTTVTTTDDDGNEIQTEEYTGASESLLDIVKDIRNRLAGIEANEIVDDATDSALLTLIGNLAARVSALEAG